MKERIPTSTGPNLTADERMAIGLVQAISIASREDAAIGIENKGLDAYGARIVNSLEYRRGIEKIHNFEASINEGNPQDRSY